MSASCFLPLDSQTRRKEGCLSLSEAPLPAGRVRLGGAEKVAPPGEGRAQGMTASVSLRTVQQSQMMKTPWHLAHSGSCFPIACHLHIMKFCMCHNCSQPLRSPDYPSAFTCLTADLLSLSLNSTSVGKAEKKVAARKARIRVSGRKVIVVSGFSQVCCSEFARAGEWEALL